MSVSRCFSILSFAILYSCDEESNDLTYTVTGNSATYDLSSKDVDGISGNAIFIENIDGSFSADPKVEIEEFTQYFNLKIDPLIIDAETLGGLVINELGVLPKVGDVVSIENLNIKVTHADGRKITKVLITKNWWN